MSETMSENAAQARRDYYKEWRRKNPDKVSAYMKRYWEKKFQEKRSQEQPEARSADPAELVTTD